MCSFFSKTGQTDWPTDESTSDSLTLRGKHYHSSFYRGSHRKSTITCHRHNQDSGRSTADVVFGYRWLCAKAQRHRVTVEFLGIDLSRAFDTIRRDKLLDTLQTFLDESELRMLRFLLADTSLQPRLSTGDCMAFATTIGKETASVRYCSLFTLKLLSVTLGHVSRRARQKTPPYHSMWSTPTIQTL